MSKGRTGSVEALGVSVFYGRRPSAYLVMAFLVVHLVGNLLPSEKETDRIKDKEPTHRLFFRKQRINGKKRILSVCTFTQKDPVGRLHVTLRMGT